MIENQRDKSESVLKRSRQTHDIHTSVNEIGRMSLISLADAKIKEILAYRKNYLRPQFDVLIVPSSIAIMPKVGSTYNTE